MFVCKQDMTNKFSITITADKNDMSQCVFVKTDSRETLDKMIDFLNKTQELKEQTEFDKLCLLTMVSLNEEDIKAFFGMVDEICESTIHSIVVTEYGENSISTVYSI